MNQKEKNRIQVKKVIERSVQRDEQNNRIHFAATHQIKENLKSIGTRLTGLSFDELLVNGLIKELIKLQKYCIICK